MSDDAVDDTETTSKYLALIATDIPVFIVVMIVFSVLRWKYRNWIETRRQIGIERGSNTEECNPNPRSLLFSINLPDSGCEATNEVPTYWDWMIRAWRMSDEEFYQHSGIDALLFRMLNECCLRISVYCLPFGMLIVLPVYGTGRMDAKDALTSVSVANVENNSPRLAATVLSVYWMIGVALYHLSQLYLRCAFLQSHLPFGDIDDAFAQLPNLTWWSLIKSRHQSSGLATPLIASSESSERQSTEEQRKLVPKKKAVPSSSSAVSTESNDVDPNDDDDKHGDTQEVAIAMIDLGNGDSNEDGIRDNNNSELQSSDELSVSPDAAEYRTVSEANYVLMLRDMPDHLRSDDKAQKFIEDIVGADRIEAVSVIPDVCDLLALDAKVTAKKKEVRKLAKKGDIPAERVESEDCPEVSGKPKCFGMCGNETDLMALRKKERDDLIAEARKVNLEEKTSPTAFIAARSMADCAILEDTLVSSNLERMTLFRAPFPLDILWENINFSTTETRLRRTMTTIIMIALALFWSIPATFIQSLANLTEIVDTLGGDINDVLPRGFVSWLEGVLSVVLLNSWMTILPIVLAQIVKLEKHIDLADAQISSLIKYFDMLMVCLVFAQSIGGSALSNLDALTSGSVSTIFNLLGTGLATTSVFFLNYTTHITLISWAMSLLRIGFWIKKFILGLELMELVNHEFVIWLEMPRVMITLILCLTYGAMSPLIWIVGIGYFSFAYLFISHQLSTTYVNLHSSGGLRLYPHVFARLMLGVVLSLITNVTVVSLKRSYIAAAFIVPLFGVVYFIFGFVQSRYKLMFIRQNATVAAQMDRRLSGILRGFIGRTFHGSFVPAVIDRYNGNDA